MLTNISFSNYRAFRSGNFNIRPITIFIGANSVGKTSLLQLPLILKQTAAVTDKGYKAALKLHGREVSIGDNRNFFLGQNTGEPFEVTLTFRSERMKTRLSSMWRDFSAYIYSSIQYYDYVFSQKSKRPPFSKSGLEKIGAQNRSEPISDDDLKAIISYIDAAHEYLAKIPKEDIPSFGVGFIVPRINGSSRGRLQRIDAPSPIQAQDIERTHRFLRALSVLDMSEFTYNAKIVLVRADSQSSYLRVSELSISNKQSEILRLEFSTTPQPGPQKISKISSSLTTDKYGAQYQNDLDSVIDASSSIFNLVRKPSDSERFQLTQYFREILDVVQEALRDMFGEDSVGHIGPLRAYPKRFYFLDIAHTGATDGELLVETLREDDDLRKRANEWLKRFGVDINVKQLEEIIYRLAVRSKGNSFDLDITDVGFGISQVLPILVEGLISPPGKTILIEQPEIHLHPRMQGDLADLFIEISGAGAPFEKKDDQKKFMLIETHSEYFLSRLRRRLAEKKIRHTDVAIYIVEKDSKNEGGSVVRGEYVRPDGGFQWPEEFYGEELQDTIAYMMTRINIKKDK